MLWTSNKCFDCSFPLVLLTVRRPIERTIMFDGKQGLALQVCFKQKLKTGGDLLSCRGLARTRFFSLNKMMGDSILLTPTFASKNTKIGLND